MALIEKLEAQEWFDEYREVHKKEEWVWNDEIFDNEKISKYTKDHLDINFLISKTKEIGFIYAIRKFTKQKSVRRSKK